MKILTLGDSWTYGANECNMNPLEISWPAQMAKRYQVEITNLARGGGSNQRAVRIGIEELCQNSDYDYVIFPLGPACRNEILKIGKWHQIWANATDDDASRLYTKYWHAWNDVQYTIMLCFNFFHSVKALGIPLYVSGLSLHPSNYTNELGWIEHYQNNNDFRSLGMPLDDLNIGIKDLDRKLKSLRAVHNKNLELQPEYLNDVVKNYFFVPDTQQKYGYTYKEFQGHPNKQGYSALADYFAKKIGLC
jgi:hypothetical protein